MKVIAVVGYHNSGKTTLIEKLVEKLKSKGLKVGYIKHDPKRHGVTDKKGSDTDRLFRIADRVALCSPGKLTLWDKKEDDPLDILKEFFPDFDVVILEGFKSFTGIPKVAVGDVEAQGIILKVEGPEDVGHIVELLENMEENL